MNNKIIIEVFVPQSGSSYDVFIPINLTVGDITKLIIKSLSEITDNEFVGNNKLRLYQKNNGEAIDVNLVIKNSNLRNGSKVVLL